MNDDLGVRLDSYDDFVDAYINNNDRLFDYLKQIKRFVYTTVQSHPIHPESGYDAEDITQLVFMAIGKSLHSFQGKSKFSTWIGGIIVKTILGENRYHDAKKRPKTVSLDNDVIQNTLSKGNYIGANVENCLPIALKLIEEEFGTLIMLVFFLVKIEKFKQVEIASLCDMSTQQISRYLQNIIKYLKQHPHMQDCLGFDNTLFDLDNDEF